MKYPFNGRACLETEDIPSRCGFCSLGCEITVRNFGDHHYFIKSGGEPGDYLCRYGRFGNELFIKEGRMKNPVVRKGPVTGPVLPRGQRDHREQMREAAGEFGPDKVAVFVSPELTNEEFLAAAGIARDGLGTNNIGSLAILSGEDAPVFSTKPWVSPPQPRTGAAPPGRIL